MTAWVAALTWLLLACGLAIFGNQTYWLIAVAALLALLFARSIHPLRSFTMLLAFSFLLTGSSLAIQCQLTQREVVAGYADDYAATTATFEILEPVRKSQGFGFASNSFRTVIRLKTIDGNVVNSVGHLTADESLEIAEVGGSYRARLFFKPPTGSLRFAFDSRLEGTFETLKEPDAIRQAANGIRSSFLKQATGLSQDSRGLVAGLTIGDTSLLSQDIQDQMKTVGLTHLTAVSGANCAIVAGLALVLLRRVRMSRFTRLAAISSCLVGYLLLVGQQPSVLRASAMALIVVANVALGRKASAVNALGLAVLILLVADPWLALEFGFALSVAATYGILVLAPAIAEKLRAYMPRYLALALGVSIGAQVMCLPILLQLQPGLSTYSLVANLVAEPLVAPVTVMGILGCVLVPFLPFLTQLLFALSSVATWVIEQTARMLANEPATSLAWFNGGWGILAALTLIAGAIAWLRAENTAIKRLGALAVVVCLAAASGINLSSSTRLAAWPGQDWFIASCDVGQGDATVIRSEALIALIDVGKDERKVDTCLSRLGVSHIDLLVLTHFDQDHVAGLAGALKRRTVSQALTSPFPDDRPAVARSLNLLSSVGVAPTHAERGMRGQLGQFVWQVLSPEHEALGSEDSNDGSITMLFRSQAVNLATMADLGEKGQKRVLNLSGSWLGQGLGAAPLILKVSHHGSADQSERFIEVLDPALALISAGAGNSYGHPTKKTLGILNRLGSQILRTDEQGSLAIGFDAGRLRISVSGQG